MAISQKVHDVLYPNKPVLIETRDILNSFGLISPDYYDNWWLDRIEFLGSANIQYFPWSLPKNPPNLSAQAKSYSLAWACMRYSWISEAEVKGFNQFTAPLDIMEFILKTPGVEIACKVNLEYLALYAPQLLFYDSPIKKEFEKMYSKSVSNIAGTKFPLGFKCELTLDGLEPACSRIFALFDKAFGRYTPRDLLRHFIEGEQFGPRPSNLDYWDVLIALCSEQCEIYPVEVRDVLMEGFCSNYSALQLKKAFIEKAPDSLEKIFSTTDLMEQAIDEIIIDRRINVLTPRKEVARKICGLHLTKDYFADKSFRLTIPAEELKYNYRGLTFGRYAKQ